MPQLNPFYSSMAVLLHGDGTNGATTFVDSGPSAVALTTTAGPTITTAQSKFGGSSMNFNGSGRISTASLASLAFGTGVFRIGFWMRSASMATARGVFTISSSSGTLTLVMNANGSLTLAPGVSGSSPGSSASGLILLNTWHYVELGRLSNGFIYCYVDGGNVFVASIGTTASYTAGTLHIGSDLVGGTSFFGQMDEFFIAPGQLVGSVVPTDSWMDRLPQISGNVKNAAGANVARVVTAYVDGTVTGNNKVGATTSDAGTGNYTVSVTTTTPCTLVAAPAAGEALNALVLRGVQPV